MEEKKRMPACPKCHEEGKWVKGDFFMCKDRECGTLWVEKRWQERLEKEDWAAAAAERIRGIYIVISIGNVKCDECGKRIPQGETYCINHKEMIPDELSEALFRVEGRGRRFCKSCSIKHDYLKLIRDKRTGVKYFARGLIEMEEFIDKKMGETIFIKHDTKHNDKWCEESDDDVLKTSEMLRGCHCVSCDLMMNVYRNDKYYIFKCSNWHCGKFMVSQGHMIIEEEPARIILEPILKAQKSDPAFFGKPVWRPQRIDLGWCPEKLVCDHELMIENMKMHVGRTEAVCQICGNIICVNGEVKLRPEKWRVHQNSV